MHKFLSAVCLSIATFVALAHLPLTAAEPAKQPNVLFIAIDDLRDWVGYLGHQRAKTPNLDRLASRGVSFTRSYCAAPICNPSRAALVTGRRPGTSGVYDNGTDWRPLNTDVVTLPLHFKQNGYHVIGAGKITHDAYRRENDWSEFHAHAPEQDQPATRRGNEKGQDGGVGGIKFQPIQLRDEEMDDYATASFTVRHLQAKHDQPLFLACGFHKPHMPWNVPQKYFDMFPLDQIELPPTKAGDLDDLPAYGVKVAKPAGDHAAMLQSGRWKEAIQAYLATITFMDVQVGRVLDALEASDKKDNTIVVLWSDHGWHLGEKEHWRKFALWEEATRSPLIISVPGVTKPGTVCERTVDLMSLYPTLCALCNLQKPAHVEGANIVPLLKDPKAEWSTPAITTYFRGDHAVRTEKWRYIRYNDGSEELYDHDVDPHEWKNLASEAQHASVKAELAKLLPTANKAGPAGEAKQGKKKNKNK
ncbi:Choline-sulfatase [Anatilimnocola aggregata]|uniref:Choline-sulfatase n=1 Tax=Anatilimnocola aggregata TaxID=2528021 RepID=A0A517Y9J0_9BACT|nr:sulfatase [Anatilimnocola aggregata]QDU26832.1 Choline-sulfatase [Anatilimnocola aggregata]